MSVPLTRNWRMMGFGRPKPQKDRETPMRLARLLATLALLCLAALPARAFETIAKAAYVVDLTTSTVLMEQEADVPLPPASMSKLMTLNRPIWVSPLSRSACSATSKTPTIPASPCAMRASFRRSRQMKVMGKPIIASPSVQPPMPRNARQS